MTDFTITRGQARAVWASLLPHAGKASDDTPDFGRVRFAPRTTELIAWTLDGVTAAAAWADITGHGDDGADTFDLSTATLKAALAVFVGPRDPDARQMWEDQDLRVEVRDDDVVFTEVGGIVEGRSLTVERIVNDGEDRYPDVPRTLSHPAPGPYPNEARVSAEALARFIPSAKAWGGELTVTLSTVRAEVRIGTRLLGALPVRRDHGDDTERARAAQDRARADAAWVDRLTPLVRPQPARKPDDTKVTLHVVLPGTRS